MTLTAAQAVDAGIAFLDKVRPNWFDAIDLDTLNIGSTQYCILGQLHHGSYRVGITTYGLTDIECGNRGYSGLYVSNRELNAEWKRRIRDMQARSRAGEPKTFTFEIPGVLPLPIENLTWEQITALAQSMPDVAITITRK